ncbi:MAG: Na+/H+ antiporter subunit G [Actinobacteria bacterium]|nr:MAG: Na+/H+ antiporter subunit G [Actinomycetota bacterium]
MNEIVGSIILAMGVLLALIAALGVVRLPDSYSRMHASSKPQLLGLLMICVGLSIEMWSWTWVVLGIVVLLFQVLTASVGSHMVSRAIARTRSEAHDSLVVNDLAQDRAEKIRR